jgi:hypothetical protein
MRYLVAVMLLIATVVTGTLTVTSTYAKGHGNSLPPRA